MPRKKAERELRVHVVNPDAELDPRAIKRFALKSVQYQRRGKGGAPMARKKNPRTCKGCGKKLERNRDLIAVADDGEASGVAYYCPECYRRNRMAKGVRKR